MNQQPAPRKSRVGRLFAGLVFLALAGLAGWNYFRGFQSTALYHCDEAVTWRLTPRWLASLGGLNIIDGLEVYGGGWIERGQLTLTGSIFSEPLIVQAGAGPEGERPTPISFARMGEWYEPDFHLNFSPSRPASCALRVVYRYRGIL